MKRIALPMVGGVITSTLMELLVYPAIFFLWRSRGLPPPTPALAPEPLPAPAVT
jgi:Cu(I)/Ag(I) efflux system membrane protein CusA/SilA